MSDNDITKAVIPAAGLGTRMEPISSYLPKPMLPLGKRPVLQHIVDELKEAGIDDIAIVIRTEYDIIAEYFEDRSGIRFLYDDSASGPGGAVLKAEEFIDDENFLVLFSDAPMSGAGRSGYLRELIDIKKNCNARAVLSIYRIPRSEISSRGVVSFGRENWSGDGPVRLTDMLEKPTADRELSRWASACRYVLDADIFEALKEIDQDENGEQQLTPAIRNLIRKGETVLGYPLDDHITRHDTGNFEGYFRAFRDFTGSD